MNARMIPLGFQQAPGMPLFNEQMAKNKERCDALLAERATLFAVLQSIADTDSRYGLEMKEVASEAIRQILEARVEAGSQARIDARIKAARSIA